MDSVSFDAILSAPLCPSADPSMEGAALLGVVGGSGEEPRVDLSGRPDPRGLGVMRFAAPFVGGTNALPLPCESHGPPSKRCLNRGSGARRLHRGTGSAAGWPHLADAGLDGHPIAWNAATYREMWRLGSLWVDIHNLLTELAGERPLFHSEADFQFALAWLIQRRHPRAEIRLEYKPAYTDRRGYLDVWTRLDDRAVALELKYFTRRLQFRLGEEEYGLTNQSAADIGRYQFLKDLARVEAIVASRPTTTGYALALTNNDQYWKSPASPPTTIDAAFRIHEGVQLRGEMAWSPLAGAGTTKGIERPISLGGVFDVRWRDYSQVTQGPAGRFRYLLVEVRRATGDVA